MVLFALLNLSTQNEDGLAVPVLPDDRYSVALSPPQSFDLDWLHLETANQVNLDD